jgi:hypothetical protein
MWVSFSSRSPNEKVLRVFLASLELYSLASGFNYNICKEIKTFARR